MLRRGRHHFLSKNETNVPSTSLPGLLNDLDEVNDLVLQQKKLKKEIHDLNRRLEAASSNLSKKKKPLEDFEIACRRGALNLSPIEELRLLSLFKKERQNHSHNYNKHKRAAMKLIQTQYLSLHSDPQEREYQIQHRLDLLLHPIPKSKLKNSLSMSHVTPTSSFSSIAGASASHEPSPPSVQDSPRNHNQEDILIEGPKDESTTTVVSAQEIKDETGSDSISSNSGSEKELNDPDDDVKLEQEKTRFTDDRVYCRSLSTYSRIPSSPTLRYGDPVCDYYTVRICDERVISVVADGCNWGPKPREAAIRASTMFANHISLHHNSVEDTHELALLMLASVWKAHKHILKGPRDPRSAGTTTLLGGILFKIVILSGVHWMFMSVNIGDCKGFHWSQRNGKVYDFTASSRSFSRNASDPGGRIGPYGSKDPLPDNISESLADQINTQPDLRNLVLNFCLCEEGDVIFLLSDGIHDNFDPEMTGKLPFDIQLTEEKSVSWRDYTYDNFTELTIERIEQSKTKYRTDLMENLFNQYRKDVVKRKIRKAKRRAERNSNETESSNLENLENDLENAKDMVVMTPQSVNDILFKHTVLMTRSSRHFMRNNPDKKLPNDFSTFPGKMDHSTCVSLSVRGSEQFPPRAFTEPASISNSKLNLENRTYSHTFGTLSVASSAASAALSPSTSAPPGPLTSSIRNKQGKGLSKIKDKLKKEKP